MALKLKFLNFINKKKKKSFISNENFHGKLYFFFFFHFSLKMNNSKPKALLGPSILNADLSNLSFECKNLLENGVDYLHLDVMDGHFVPNLTFGHPVVKCLRSHIKDAFFDMHMMVSEPDMWVKDMAEAGGTQYTFHIEATETPGECIRLIKENGMKVGLAVSPKTPIDAIVPFVKDIDMALVMTVEPGRGGQKFMNDMMGKVEFLRSNFQYLNVSVDGGEDFLLIFWCRLTKKICLVLLRCWSVKFRCLFKTWCKYDCIGYCYYKQ